MITILFVHLGSNEPPSHLATALQQTAEIAPKSRVVLLSNKLTLNFPQIRSLSKKITLVSVEDVPPSSTTTSFGSASTLDKVFRNGFWFHASERFYRIADYLDVYQVTNCLHLENDVQLYFDPSEVTDVFERFSSVAVPLDRIRAIPGLVWFKDAAAARLLTKYILRYRDLNDMIVLGQFCAEEKNVAKPLPSIPTPYALRHSLSTERYCLSADSFRGIFDCAAIGQYLGGGHWLNDPRDSRFFINESSDLDLRDFDFSWDTHNGYRTPKIKFEGSSTPILAIHVHSKNMKAFAPTNTGAPTAATDIVTSDRLQALCDLTISTAALAPSDRLKHGVTRRVIEIPEKIEGGLFKLQRRRERIPPSEDFINICRSSRSIFVPAELLYYFQTYISPRLHNDFVIVTDNFAQPIGFDRLPLLNHPNLVVFFAQNTKLHHSKIVSLPIGANNIEPDDKNIAALFNQSKKISKTDNLYVDTTATNSHSYGSMLAAVEKLVHFRNFSNQKYEQYLKILATHKFCICPGAGSNNRYLFWEAQYLDCIPIIMKDDWIPAYSGLPLLIVNSWEDLSLLNLNQEYIRITTTAFDRSALSMEHHRAAMARLINKRT
jgi:hypothetical protein